MMTMRFENENKKHVGLLMNKNMMFLVTEGKEAIICYSFNRCYIFSTLLGSLNHLVGVLILDR